MQDNSPLLFMHSHSSGLKNTYLQVSLNLQGMMSHDGAVGMVTGYGLDDRGGRSESPSRVN
jgi:hypothetical protein